MTPSRDNQPTRKSFPRLRHILLYGTMISVILAMVILVVRKELWDLLAKAIGIGTMCGIFFAVTKLSPHELRSWRRIGSGLIKCFILFLVLSMVADALLGDEFGPAMRFNAFFIMALLGASLLYLFLVSSGIRLRLPGISAKDTNPKATKNTQKKREASTAEEHDVTTLQVTRLSSGGTHITIENTSPLPILRAETTLNLIREADAPGDDDKTITQVTGTPFSIRAAGAHPAALGSTFDHVGIYRLHTAGIRVHDLVGLFSRTCGASGLWRVRVVPNIYRLSYGIPRDRRVRQDSLGIPDSPADALDYDRVRDYRPGDPLKTIHWKLVAHGQGDLYTKLFETPTASAITLVIDPYGPNVSSLTKNSAYHLYDTMLEGGFTLLEHAREYGIPGHVRFVNREGMLVETRWDGTSMLGSFVERVRRPTSSLEERGHSAAVIRSLRDRHAGYVIFTTSYLCDNTVEELIACHQADVSLLVIHAIPTSPNSAVTQQRTYDERLRAAMITVIALENGSQIVREVTPS